MGGIVGVTTHTFLMIAAALCLPMRVDHNRVEAVIDGDVPVSVISTKLAEKLHLPIGQAADQPVGLRRPIHVSIGAEEFSVASIAISDAPFADEPHHGRDLILGQDMLQAHVLDVDFSRRTARLVLPSEYRRDIRGLQPVAITAEAQPIRRALAIADGHRAVLDLPHGTVWIEK